MRSTLPLRSRGARIVASAMAVFLIVGGLGLIVSRGAPLPPADSPAHLAATLSELPANARQAAARTVELSIATPGHSVTVPALVVHSDLAVTTTKIPINAMITGSTSTKVNFPVQLVGRDNLTGFSIVRLSEYMIAPRLGPMPANSQVTVVTTVESSSTTPPRFVWATTTLGDPTIDATGVVRYLAVASRSSLANMVDAVAVDSHGRVVAVQSQQHRWFGATFVAKVADVVASGRGCHAWLGIEGRSEQGGGVAITSVAKYSAAAHAGLKVGDVLTQVNGTDLDSWQSFASIMYLTPAYTTVRLQWAHGAAVHSTVVTAGCNI